MKSELEARFKAFVRAVPGAESIDDLEELQTRSPSKRADFFFDNRRIVCELKSLQIDTEYKIDRILAPHRNRPEFPVFVGRWDLAKVLKFLPDGDEIGECIYTALTSSIEDKVEDANRQIRETKVQFGVQSSNGLLIILNDLVGCLSPDRVMYRVNDAMQKKTLKGDKRFPNIDAVWIISEAHFIATDEGEVASRGGLIGLDKGDTKSVRTADFAKSLQDRWVLHNDWVAKDEGFDILQRHAFKRLAELEPPVAEPRRLQNRWCTEYEVNRYLEICSEDDLLHSGSALLQKLALHYAKGHKLVREQLLEFREKWTHFLEEVRMREIDLRGFALSLDEPAASLWGKVGSVGMFHDDLEKL